MNDVAELVLGSSLGAELTNQEAGVIADLMSRQELVDGEFLINEGATDDSLHVLLTGKLEVVKSTGADETASLAILRAGALAGELSFVDGAVHTVGLRALCDSQVLSLKRAEFENIVTGASAAGLQGHARGRALGAPHRAPHELRVHRTQQLHLQTTRAVLSPPALNCYSCDGT